MTWGNNFVADVWAGAYNPHPYPSLPTHTQTDTTAVSRMPISHFLITTDGLTNGRTEKGSCI